MVQVPSGEENGLSTPSLVERRRHFLKRALVSPRFARRDQVGSKSSKAIRRIKEEDPMKRLLVPVLFLILSVPVGLHSADQEKKPEPPRYETRKVHDPDGIGKFYMGREIAQVMGHLAAGWLERPEREKEEAPSKLIEALKVKEGQVIADIGAGSGYFTFRLAKQVGPKGKILAVDIQKEMLDIIRQRMKDDKVANVEPILGTETDPKLPDNSVDIILVVDVYHEFSYPYEMTV